jgi:hypothetical protein
MRLTPPNTTLSFNLKTLPEMNLPAASHGISMTVYSPEFAILQSAIMTELSMTATDKKRQTFIIDLEKLNSLNAEGCAACGRKFTLGETVVKACGAWEGPPKLIHQNEAVWDVNSATYFERRCYDSRKP